MARPISARLCSRCRPPSPLKEPARRRSLTSPGVWLPSVPFPFRVSLQVAFHSSSRLARSRRSCVRDSSAPPRLDGHRHQIRAYGSLLRHCHLTEHAGHASFLFFLGNFTDFIMMRSLCANILKVCSALCVIQIKDCHLYCTQTSMARHVRFASSEVPTIEKSKNCIALEVTEF